jgi:large subunit ribosomal protein L29
MKKNELKTKTILELQVELHASLREQFNLRMQKGIDPQQVKSSAFKNVRRLIARIKTIMHQKANEL